MSTKLRTAPSRRDFLKGMGAAGAGLVAGSLSGASTAQEADAAPSPVAPTGYAKGSGGAPRGSGDFGRIFPNLPPFADANATVRAALTEVGQPGGLLDANDDLAAGPKSLIVDPSVNGNPTSTNPYGTNPDNPSMTAGSTFVGQFIDHDITFDQTSQLGVPQNPLISPNTRTPALDLDSVFGGGPGLRPDLYVDNPDSSLASVGIDPLTGDLSLVPLRSSTGASSSSTVTKPARTRSALELRRSLHVASDGMHMTSFTSERVSRAWCGGWLCPRR